MKSSSIRKNGFTLIEILVVVSIMGILLSIVMENIGSAQARSRDHKRISDIKSLQLALEQYYDGNNAFPTAGNLSVLAPAYVPSIQTDPSTKAPYDYSTGLNNNSFCLGAQLEITSTTSLSDDAGCSTGVTPTNPANYYTLRNP
ncbi:MAG: type II secretion system protein [bacterium]